MRIAFYLPNLRGGGAERVTLGLCEELASRGHELVLLLDHCDGEYVDDIPDSVSTRTLAGATVGMLAVVRYMRSHYEARALLEHCLASRKPWFTLVRVTRLRDYLETHRCDVLVAALGYAPFIAYWANLMAGEKARVVCVEHTAPSRGFLARELSAIRVVRLNQIKNLMREVYPKLSGIVAVSEGVAEDTADFVRLERRRVRAIYNPTPVDRIRSLSIAAEDHPWFGDPSKPLLLAVGRLVSAKNFRLLLDALSRLEHVGARLIILGEGPLRPSLVEHSRQIGVSERVDFCGWRNNPYAYMKHANVFVQSSDREGLGMALIEALACGCPIVATDCKSGPREILDHGRYGALVPMHDVAALAKAIEVCLLDPRSDKQTRIDRAMEFSVARSVDAYESLFQELLAGNACHCKRSELADA